MSTLTIDLDQKQYGQLLAATRPTIIKSEAENNRLLSCIESLMQKGENNLSPEEDALLELLVSLVHDFEQRQYPIPEIAPHQMVGYLLEQQGQEPSALLPILGSRSRVSELLSGKRSISKDQARKLSAFFKKSIELFI
ncbi:MAG: transcriptional regulator [Verrucomicrobia bacterium]|nr:transcriptional regulator [Verrucomicrobiota bacterium]